MRALLDSSGNPVKVGNQEDVSEFNHLFLQRVQQGFRAAAAAAATPSATAEYPAGRGADDGDFVAATFEGKMVQELAAVNPAGQRQVLSSKKEDFLEVILDITRNKDVHAALQDYVEAQSHLACFNTNPSKHLCP